MSSTVPQSSSAAHVHQARTDLEELEAFCREAHSPAEFLDKLLTKVVSATRVDAGVIWNWPLLPGTAPQFHTGIDVKELLTESDTELRHAQLIHAVVARGEAIAIPAPATGQASAQPNPTRSALLFGLLCVDIEVVAVLELFHAPCDTETVGHRLKLLTWGCELASQTLTAQRNQELEKRQELTGHVEEFGLRVHQVLDVKTTCFAIVNEGRRFLQADRVSVARYDGRRCRIQAISGQDTFDSRSNAVRMLAELSTAVARAGESVWYVGDPENLAPQLEEPVQTYADGVHTSVLALQPLWSTPAADTGHACQVLGVIIVEYMSPVATEGGVRTRLELVNRHAAMSLGNAIEHHSLFLMPLWKTLGKTKWVVQARRLPKTLLIGGIVLVALLALCLIPVDFEVESKGTLEPLIKRDVFAPYDGVVARVDVEHGALVDEKSPLVLLDNSDLDVEITGAEGQLLEAIEQLLSLDRQRSNPQTKPDELSRLSSQVAEKHALRKSLEQQIALLKRKRQQLTITSPIAGQVVTWQVRDRLVHRPVQRGQTLLTVADLAGPWELELHVPENHIGFLVSARRDLQQDLPVRFYLASRPGEVRTGTIRSVHTTADIHGEDGNTVLVRVQLDKADFAADELRPGVNTTAKIHCGRSSLLYAWFHDAIGWVQRTWFKL